MSDIESHIWVEKHRPKTLDDIVGHEDKVKRLKNWLHDDEMPNILLEGPQGTGKTAAVTAFARDKYGDDAWRNNVLELNASDERGIDTIREKVKSFARQGTVGDYQYKIIFLDEVDSTTKDAQAAMRRVMEDYSDTTRFFLSCNYANKIIQPIQSRCVPMRFGRLDTDDITGIIERVADAEGVEYEESGIRMLAEDSGGDARKAVNALQASALNGELTEDGIKAVISVVDYQLVRDIINTATEGNLDEAMNRLDQEILKEGVSEQQFLDTSMGVIKSMNLPADTRAKCIDKIAECDWRIINGANPHIQLHSFLANVHVAYHLSLPNYQES